MRLMNRYKRISKMTTLFIMLLGLSFCQSLMAEGILMKSQPRDQEVLAAFDGNVKLWFGGNVSERTPTLVILDSQGNRIDNKDLKLTLSSDRSELSATTKTLNAGQYVVRYRVVTDDGLIVSGILRFSVK